MDRLTEKFNGEVQLKAARNPNGVYCVCPEICDDVDDKYGNVECCDNCPIQKAFNRLAAYEDTGLEPDEIPKWIPCSEKLPETDETNSHKFDVLVYVPKRDGCHQSGYFIGKLHKVEADNTGNTNFWGVKTPGSEWTLWGWSYFEEPIPSHWIPLPQPPKGEKS